MHHYHIDLDLITSRLGSKIAIFYTSVINFYIITGFIYYRMFMSIYPELSSGGRDVGCDFPMAQKRKIFQKLCFIVIQFVQNDKDI